MQQHTKVFNTHKNVDQAEQTQFSTRCITGVTFTRSPRLLKSSLLGSVRYFLFPELQQQQTPTAALRVKTSAHAEGLIYVPILTGTRL